MVVTFSAVFPVDKISGSPLPRATAGKKMEYITTMSTYGV